MFNKAIFTKALSMSLLTSFSVLASETPEDQAGGRFSSNMASTYALQSVFPEGIYDAEFLDSPAIDNPFFQSRNICTENSTLVEFGVGGVPVFYYDKVLTPGEVSRTDLDFQFTAIVGTFHWEDEVLKKASLDIAHPIKWARKTVKNVIKDAAKEVYKKD